MNKYLYFIVSLITFSLITIAAFSQDVTQSVFLSDLDNKETATYGDALIIFNLQSGSSASIKNLSESAKKKFTLNDYDEKAVLTRGIASLMTARYLDLGGSFMYLLFETERYAYTVCVTNEIFPKNGSENDIMSGPELIELLSRISEIKGGK
jgi:hypothetical protein